MDSIIINELEVRYRIGVPDVERAHPQRLLLSLELWHDFTAAAAADDLTKTINYFAVCQRLLHLGEGREWKLIETLAAEIVDIALREFRADEAAVEVRKFIIPETRYVAVRSRRRRTI
ncbi:MAG TPA: dihydroneopterin aldolase [Candidatus Limnocylindria bacterium]|jgi:FolB domain-containing protein|nr:dihydroneopterin aldolase [Candidatus Limnocylindria bacterium]